MRRRAALVVVDMQNHFVAEGFRPSPRARSCHINRLARAMRAAGGQGCGSRRPRPARWSIGATTTNTCSRPSGWQSAWPASTRAPKASKLYPALEPLPSDLRVKKIKYSAFIQGSSDIDAQLKARGIDTVLIAGTATNVCCESTARDAMLLDYRVIMLSDANATWSDEEHAATLNSFMLFFGDVMTADEAIGRLVPVASRKRA